MTKGKRRKPNGQWDPAFIAAVVAFAKENFNAEAIRKFDIPASTLYGWLRRPEFNR